MRSFFLFLLAAVALPAQTLSIVSGNGQIVLAQFLTTVPLVVQATDASGKPAVGVNVTWAITQGSGTLEGPPTIQTDSNGQASLMFLATDVPPGSSYVPITISATAGSSTVNFVLNTVLSRQTNGGLAAPPQGKLVTPQPDGTITGAAGSTIAGAVQILVVALSGAQAGQPVPNVGVRILPPSDPSQPSAACNGPGGIVLTNAQGLATCDLILGPHTGTTQLTARIGEAQDTPPFTLTVTPGVACTFTLSPLSQSVVISGGTATVGINTTAGCSWTVASSATWVVPAQLSGTGSGSVSYTVAANTGAARTATLTIAGQAVTINQAGTSGPQPLTITTSATLPPATLGATYTTALAATGGSGQYAWTLYGALPPGLQLSPAGTISGVPSTPGNYTFNIGVKDSVSGVTQSQNFAMAVLGSSGTLVITTSSLPNGSIGQSYQQNLVSSQGCVTPFSQTPSFRLIDGSLPPGLTIQQINGAYAIAGTPTTVGTYSFTVGATDACGNIATAKLSIVIGGGAQATTLAVSPQSLQFSLLNGSSTVPASQTLTLSSTSPLTFSAAASTASGGNWLSLNSGTGTTPASVTVSVSNASQLAPGNYNGSITITSQASNSPLIVPVSFTVTAPQNTLVVTPTMVSATLKNSGSTSQQQALTIGSGGAQLAFSATFSTVDGGHWLSVNPLNGTTPAVVTVTLNAANLSPGAYVGTVIIATTAGQQAISVSMTVVSGSTLSATPNALTFNVGPNAAAPPQVLGIAGFPGILNFMATTSTTNGGSWLSVTPVTGTTPVTISVAVNTTNLTAGTYSGVVSLQPSDPTVPVVNVPVTLNLAPSTPTILAVTNAASFAPGPVSPGELLVIFGTQLGPQTLVSGLSTSLAGTQVTFDSLPAPVLYTEAGQVATIVPFEIAGRASTTLQMTYNGAPSNTINLVVQDSTPAMFTLETSGQGAILNQDSSINSAGNAAAIGSYISIYATGGGQTNPLGVDGQITPSTPGSTLPMLTATVHVQIAGRDAMVTYAGGAPGLAAGVVQVNAQVPAGVPSGAQIPVLLIVGAQSSPPVFMAVQ